LLTVVTATATVFIIKRYVRNTKKKTGGTVCLQVHYRLESQVYKKTKRTALKVMLLWNCDSELSHIHYVNTYDIIKKNEENLIKMSEVRLPIFKGSILLQAIFFLNIFLSIVHHRKMQTVTKTDISAFNNEILYLRP